MTAAVITAVTDGYDILKPIPPQDVACEQIVVSDDPDLSAEGWTTVYEPRNGKHPNLAAKRPKCCPWDYTDADWVIWIDASFRVLSSGFVSELLAYGPLGQFTHWDRDCALDEAEYSATLGKYAECPLDKQAAYYRTLGHPAHWGLWATGLIVRERTPAIEAFGHAWLAECERWSFQDQVSEAPMLRQHGLRPTVIPGTYTSNLWVQFAGSARH